VNDHATRPAADLMSRERLMFREQERCPCSIAAPGNAGAYDHRSTELRSWALRVPPR
jgi:hypothetical protein